MKITKRQLRRIIKEEKAKLVEQGSGAVENSRRSQGMYSDMSNIDAVQSAISTLYEQTVEAAYGDLGDDNEMVEDEAIGALVITVAEAFQSLGLVGPYQALMKVIS